jgi:hypothetical protein
LAHNAIERRRPRPGMSGASAREPSSLEGGNGLESVAVRSVALPVRALPSTGTNTSRPRPARPARSSNWKSVTWYEH